MKTDPCPECGSTDCKQEPGEYALLGLSNGKLTLHVDTANAIDAVIVRAAVCQGCGYVVLHESA